MLRGCSAELAANDVWFLGRSLHGGRDWVCHGIYGVAGDARRDLRVVVPDAAGAILAAEDFEPWEL